MDTRSLILLLAPLLPIPSALAAQEFAIGGRAGTLGFGAEAAVGLSENRPSAAASGRTFTNSKGISMK